MLYPYEPLWKLLTYIDEPARLCCQQIYDDNIKLFMTAPGSSHNHQAWPGGYYDHVTEVMNWGVVLFNAIRLHRPPPFTLSDALLILFLHDIEKPWRYRLDTAGRLVTRDDVKTKSDRKRFRDAKLRAYGIQLTGAQHNALMYVEGELDDYSPERRVMNELAAFCHMCDVWSARGQYNYPAIIGDPWRGAKRSSQ